MLKRIGAAGAIAWVTPAISSLSTPAFAASQGNSTCSSPCTDCFTEGSSRLWERWVRLSLLDDGRGRVLLRIRFHRALCGCQQLPQLCGLRG